MKINNINRYFTGGIGLIISVFITLGFFITNDDDLNVHSSHAAHEMTEDSETLNKILLEGESVTVSDGDTVVVRSFGADLSYDITEIRATAGDTFTIEYDNTESTMPHNIVFVNSEADIQPVGIASLQAAQNDYIPTDQAMLDRIFAYTSLARAGDVVYVTVTVPEAGSYPYICTYPGHFTMMQGRLISQ
jgi:azurin